MKKFLINIIAFAVSLFIFDKLFYVLLLLSPSLEKDNRLEMVINGEMNNDIIILGSSRGARNIIAKQMEDALKTSTYNLSYPGSDIEFHEFLLRSLITHNKAPKTVILTVDDKNELLTGKSIKFRFDRLYPLAKYKYINNEMIARNENSFLSRFLMLSRINKSNFNLRKQKFTALDSVFSNGSMPISFQKEDLKMVYNTENTKYNTAEELTEKVNAFLNFQKLCESNNIKLYLVFPPNYKNHNQLFEKRMRELSNPETLFFIYNTTNTKYKDKTYYYDAAHLEKKGAIVFTNELIEELKSNKY